MDDLNVKRIDAPWPDQWREGLAETMKVGLEDFMDEITGIRKLLEVQNTPGVTQADLAKFYTEGGSKSSAASLPPDALVTPSAGGVWVPPTVQRQQLAEMAKKTGVVPPTPSEADTQEMAAGGSGSTPTKMEEIEEEMRGTETFLSKNPIGLPQHYGGKYTIADIATLGSQYYNRKFQEAKEAKDIEAMQKYSGPAQKATELATETIPNWQAKAGLLMGYGGDIMNWSKGLSQYGTALGMQPGEGFLGSNNIGIGPLHFRAPWNSTTLAGGWQMAKDFGTSMTVPGASTGTIMGFRQEIAGRGWQESNGTLSQPGEEIMGVMTKLFGRGGVFQELSENPEVLDLLDKATRSGTKGIDEMTKTIESIPDAAEAAHETIGQMVKDMNSYGELSQSQGGTHAAGQEQALQVAALTGIPASSLQSLFESPVFQGKVLQKTGVPSFMQGTVPTAQKAQMAVGLVHEFAGMVGNNFTGHNKTTIGGFEGHVGAQDEKVAMIHAYMEQTGIQMNPEQIKKLLNENPRRLKVSGELQEAAQFWKENTMGAIRKHEAHPHNGNYDAGANLALTASRIGKHNFGQLLRTIGQQTTVNNKGEVVPFASREDIKALRTGEGENMMSYEGLHGAELATAKYKNVQKFIEMKTRKDADRAGSPTNPAVIELGPQARQFFTFQNKKYRMKLESNAGSGQPVNSSFTGYSNAPSALEAGTGRPLGHPYEGNADEIPPGPTGGPTP